MTGTYLRHGSQPRAERVVEGLQGFLLQIDEADNVAIMRADGELRPAVVETRRGRVTLGEAFHGEAFDRRRLLVSRCRNLIFFNRAPGVCTSSTSATPTPSGASA